MSKKHTASEHEPPKGPLKNLKTLWGFMAQYPSQIALASFFLVISALTVLAIPVALGDLIDAGKIDEYAKTEESVLSSFLIVVSVMAVSTGLRFYFVTSLGERVVADIRSAIYSRLVTLSPEFYHDNRPGEIVSRLTADTTLVQSIVGSSISIWARNLLIAIGGTTMLFFMSPKLMMIIAVVIPVILFVVIYSGRRMRTLSRKSQDRVADVGAKASESLQALPVVQAFTRETTEIDRFGATVEDAFATAKRRIRVRAAMTTALIFLMFGSIAFVMNAGIGAVSKGNMSSGDIAAFMTTAIFVAGAFGALSEVYSDLQRAAGAAGRLAELLGSVSKIQAPESPTALTEPVSGKITFENVNFAYNVGNETVLSDFNLTLNPGETVALVGPSGAGKSTVLQLLLRFYDPQQGRITLDGHDLRDLDPTHFREHLALVPQETTVFADTLAENIRYGRLDATMADIEKAAEAASLDFIKRLPDGFATELGERGAKLSGGQRQRVAIARALLRQAPVLLLDEATSALDAESEQKVQHALETLMQGRTTLVIAHRLATIKKADRIIVMDEGKIVAEGNHETLIQQDGLYRRLASLQFGMQ